MTRIRLSFTPTFVLSSMEAIAFLVASGTNARRKKNRKTKRERGRRKGEDQIQNYQTQPRGRQRDRFIKYRTVTRAYTHHTRIHAYIFRCTPALYLYPSIFLCVTRNNIHFDRFNTERHMRCEYNSKVRHRRQRDDKNLQDK